MAQAEKDHQAPRSQSACANGRCVRGMWMTVTPGAKLHWDEGLDFRCDTPSDESSHLNLLLCNNVFCPRLG